MTRSFTGTLYVKMKKLFKKVYLFAYYKAKVEQGSPRSKLIL